MNHWLINSLRKMSNPHWLFIFLITSLLSSPSEAQMSSPPGTPELKQLVEDLIESYLSSRPEVIERALQGLAVKRQEQEAARVKQMIAQHQVELERDPASPVSGNVTGDVTVVEFFDYRCAYCKRVASVLEQLQKEDPRVRIVYKDFPILGADSLSAAKAALASQAQGRHTEFHGALLGATDGLTRELVLRLANEVGLNIERLVTDMENSEQLVTLTRNQTLAKDLGITGTPAFIIGNQLVLGAVDLTAIKALITQARTK